MEDWILSVEVVSIQSDGMFRDLPWRQFWHLSGANMRHCRFNTPRSYETTSMFEDLFLDLRVVPREWRSRKRRGVVREWRY